MIDIKNHAIQELREIDSELKNTIAYHKEHLINALPGSEQERRLKTNLEWAEKVRVAVTECITKIRSIPS